MRNKQKLTQQLIDLISGDQPPTVESVLPIWWYNLRKNGGMRLTSTGYKTFVDQLELEHYDYAIDDPLLFNQYTVLELDRKMQLPYYIHIVKGVPKKISFFSSREAVMINLYKDLKHFLDNYHI